MHSYANVLFAAATSSALTDRDEHTRHLAVMPVFHVAGKLNAVDPNDSGGTTVLLTRYEPEAHCRRACGPRADRRLDHHADGPGATAAAGGRGAID